MSASPRPPTRITIVDDHVLFAESLTLTLESEGNRVRRLDLSDRHTTLASVLAAVQRTTPRIVLLDLDLGRIGDATRLIDPLAAAGISVIVLTGSAEQVRWGECLRRGARIVLSKSTPLDQVLATVRRARDNLPLMSPEQRTAMIERAQQDQAELRGIRSRLERLTHREMEVLGALMQGAQVRDIAARGVVSEATVRTQVKSILAKLETNSQIAAVGAAYRAGWHPPHD